MSRCLPTVFLLIGALSLLPFWLEAQEVILPKEKDPFSWGVRGHSGFIIAHSRELIDVSKSNPFGFELSALWLLHSPKHTDAMGLISKRGFALHYIDFDNPPVLGRTVSFVPFVEPCIRPWKPLYASLRLGLGPAWLTRLYDETDNPTNLFFSFPLSLWAMLNAHLHYRASPQWEFSAGINYNHISNGGMRNPNKGMNFPTYNAGLSYALTPISVSRPERNKSWKQQPRRFGYVLAIGTAKNTDSNAQYPEVKACWSAGFLAVGGYRVGRLSGISAGTEWIHDGFAQEMQRRSGGEKSAWKGGLLVGHELLLGRVSFGTHFGAYLFNPTGDRDPVYQRYGLYWRSKRHLMFGSSLKAHRHVADVFDLRLGWHFTR
jgi:hypothetical protein